MQSSAGEALAAYKAANVEQLLDVNKLRAEFFDSSPQAKAHFGSADAYVDHKLAAMFSASDALQQEFGSFERFSAYMNAVGSGHGRICRI